MSRRDLSYSLKERTTWIGSGRCEGSGLLRLAGRTVHLSYEKPWRLVVARGRNDNWWRALKRARTFFEAHIRDSCRPVMPFARQPPQKARPAVSPPQRPRPLPRAGRPGPCSPTRQPSQSGGSIRCQADSAPPLVGRLSLSGSRPCRAPRATGSIFIVNLSSLPTPVRRLLTSFDVLENSSDQMIFYPRMSAPLLFSDRAATQYRCSDTEQARDALPQVNNAPFVAKLDRPDLNSSRASRTH